MINLEKTIQQLKNNAAIIRAFVQPIAPEQADWKPDPESWSIKEVMDHLYNEERLDFRKHLKEMLSDPPQPWGKSQPQDWVSGDRCTQVLQDFLAERESSLDWLGRLKEPDWEVTSKITFGPSNEAFILSAGDVLASWVAHDFLHIRQLNELLYAHQAQASSPHSVRYAGDW